MFTGAVPLDAERPAVDIQADRAKSMAARLADGFALATFASQFGTEHLPASTGSKQMLDFLVWFGTVVCSW